MIEAQKIQRGSGPLYPFCPCAVFFANSLKRLNIFSIAALNGVKNFRFQSVVIL